MPRWVPIPNFEGYSVSDEGEVRTDKTGRILKLSVNQFGVVNVGMMREGVQHHRSIPLLVARAFIETPFEAFDTPINLDGDRHNNRVGNLEWRPRWFAIKYNQQFVMRYMFGFPNPCEDVATGEVTQGSWETSLRYGLLERDLVLSIMNRTYVWPTYQTFRAIGSLEE